MFFGSPTLFIWLDFTCDWLPLHQTDTHWIVVSAWPLVSRMPSCLSSPQDAGPNWIVLTVCGILLFMPLRCVLTHWCSPLKLGLPGPLLLICVALIDFKKFLRGRLWKKDICKELLGKINRTGHQQELIEEGEETPSPKKRWAIKQISTMINCVWIINERAYSTYTRKLSCLKDLGYLPISSLSTLFKGCSPGC